MTNLDFVAIGQHIRERRLALGMTQEAVANYLDVNPSHISNIECGRANPSLTALVQIANMLECSVDCFLCDEYIYKEENDDKNSINKKLSAKLNRCSVMKKEKLLKIIDIL